MGRQANSRVAPNQEEYEIRAPHFIFNSRFLPSVPNPLNRTSLASDNYYLLHNASITMGTDSDEIERFQTMRQTNEIADFQGKIEFIDEDNKSLFPTIEATNPKIQKIYQFCFYSEN
jgi:hypothetical protein